MFLRNYVEGKLIEAQKELASNSDAERAKQVSDKLQNIFNNLFENGFSSDLGSDKDLRPAYVIMQGIIESAIVDYKQANAGHCASYIVTPRMPTPLMQDTVKNLSAVDFNSALDFAYFRKPIVELLLATGVTLKAIYFKDAQSALSGNKGLEIYHAYMAKYPYLKDLPVLYTDKLGDFAGAMYDFGNEKLTVESKQVSNDPAQGQTVSSWSIKLGDSANSRFEDVKNWVIQNSLPGSIDWSELVTPTSEQELGL